MDRVKAYVDGFNLYYGMKHRHGRKYLWLDLQALVKRLLKPTQRLIAVDYFTARVHNQPDSEQRQSTYLDALAAYSPTVSTVEGRFQRKRYCCPSCGLERHSYEEKETDVSIAVQIVEDAARDVFDRALLVSGDSDLCPAVRSLKRVRPDKRVVAAFPPQRHSSELAKVCDGVLHIGEAQLRQSQLPAEVLTRSGICLKRPAYWV